MSSQPTPAYDPERRAETEVRALYRQILNGWNRRSADAIADLFADDGDAIGFDGSELEGRDEIRSGHKKIFGDHQTGAFIGKVRKVTLVDPEVAVLNAVAGMVPPGKSDIDSKLNAIQRVVAARHDGHWEVVLFQNTPAQFHDRPDEADALTDELRRQL